MARVLLLSPTWRLVTAALVALGLLTLPTYLLALILLPPVPPIVMIRSFLLGTALPLCMAWGMMRAFAGSLAVRDGELALRRGDLEMVVPCTAIAGVRPWWIALPAPGLSLRLHDGRNVPLGVAFDDPLPPLDALATFGIDTTGARHHPSLTRAATRPRRPWWGAALKFGVLGILPASLLFYTHQHIAYGGPFGQYYLESPRAYFTSFAQYWATTAILLLSYASLWRTAAELIVWTIAAITPSHTQSTRNAVETLCALAYYAGVPAMLAFRYLAD